MTEEQLSRLRTWAASLAADGRGERVAAARTIRALADRVEQLQQGKTPYWEGLDLLEAKRLARQLSSGGGPAARRSAARAITLLVDEHERLAPSAPGVVPAWTGQNGNKGRENAQAGNGRPAPSENGAAQGNGRAPTLPAEARENGRAPAALKAPKRMPPREQRAPVPPPPRDPDEPMSTALGGLRPSGGAVRRALYWLIGAAIVVGTFVYAPRLAAPDITVSGPTEERLGMAEADVLTFSVSSPAVENAKWSLDGDELGEQAVKRNVERRGAISTFRAVALPEGEHTVTVEVGGPIPGAVAKHEWAFFVDLTPPTIELDPNSGKADWGEPVSIWGTLGEDASVSVAGRDAEVENEEFAVRFETPPRRSIVVRATDTAGNVTEQKALLNIIPREPPTPVRAMHVTFYAWKSPELRAHVLELVDSGKVTAVELDLKDESGVVGFDANVPLAERMGAEQPVYDLEKAVDLLHSKGVRVIGRLVAFRDEIHADWAFTHGRKKQVVLTPGGDQYAGYGGFTNFANPTVRRYNIAVSKAAVAAGVDEVLYDYVRRPDGPLSSMRFPGLKGSAEKSVAAFLRETREQIPTEIFLGASVFGVAATRPGDVAQNIPMMARELDYVSAMLYPSHWTPGEYNVPDPNAQPYDIVRAALADFEKQVHGTGARLVPWLQDFTLGYPPYGAEEVQAQIQAVHELGIDEWLLWNPNVRYSGEALEEHPGLPPIED